MIEKLEGFWFSKQEPGLPKPIPKPGWSKKKQFLDALDLLESKTEAIAYRGFSTCRLCGIPNGCQEFERQGWKWPNGYLHYVRDHDVRPSKEFQEFVFESTLRG